MLVLLPAAQAQAKSLIFDRGDITETYQGNMDTGELTINWGKKTKGGYRS